MSERTNKIYDWPLINLGHIFHYILKAKRFSEDYIRRYKDEKAYSYFDSGFIDEILTAHPRCCHKHFLFRAFMTATFKVQSCKLYNNKYMIASTQISNTEISAFIAVLVFKLLSRKVLFRNRKDNMSCLKVGYFLRKLQIFLVNHCKITNSWNAKFLGYFRNT